MEREDLPFPEDDRPDSPFIEGSDTSEEAAWAIDSVAGRLRRKVFECIVWHAEHGATDEELQINLGMIGSTERPRRIELRAAGLVVDSGLRRKTHSGRDAVVWIAKRFKDAVPVAVPVAPTLTAEA